MTKTCGECPVARKKLNSSKIYCPYLGGFTSKHNRVCRRQKTFEILRNEVRRLRAERCAMQDLRKEPIP